MYRHILTAIMAAMIITPLYAQNEGDDPVETRPFQLSIFPFIGTEGIYSHNYIYNMSINLFAGFTGGVDGVELGGFININRYSMSGIQVSGFGNIVNGEVEGVQMAGFLNVSNSFTEGVQGSGFINVVNSGARILQGSGFGNIINGDASGIQAAGFGNVINGDAEIIQASGFGNAARGSVTGLQAAGFGNVAGGNLNGLQAAGFGNVTGRKIRGIQAAGFGNISNEVEGIQMAGFLNVARNVKGMQIGFINVADSIDGIPLGFLSIVRDGYRKLELSAGDAMNLNLGFKIGVRRFYNIFSAGTHFTGGNSVYSLGYGIGSEFYLPDNRFINAEIHTHQLFRDRLWDEHLNALNQLKITYAINLNERWQFFAGPVLNFQVTRLDTEEDSRIDTAPYSLLEFSCRNTETTVWLGVNAGLRFW